MELYVDHGYDATTVAEIAERAGLTERTFFRHFADKREVLFSGSAQLAELLAEEVVRAPEDSSPIETVGAALAAAGALIQQRGEWSKQRQAVIAANAELRERELIKLASLAAVLAEALRARGVKEPSATLTSEAGVAAFKVAFAKWVEQPTKRNLPRLVRQSLDDLRTIAAGRP